MTTQTETLEAPKGDAEKPAKAPEAPGKGSSILAGFVASLAVYAFLAWVAGVALNKGFGVHVPFVAGWLLLMTGGFLVKHLATNVASTWHHARVLADIDLMAASMAVQESMRQQQGEGLAGLLAKLSEPTDTDNGSYL